MLIIALVLALIGLVALVFAVVTSNELVAWVCIGASVLGVVLLIIDALRERQHRDAGVSENADKGIGDKAESPEDEGSYVDYPEEASTETEESAAESTEQSAVSAEGRGDDSAK